MELHFCLFLLNPNYYQNKTDQILMYLIANISHLFLAERWRLEISSRLFYDFNEMTVIDIYRF